MSAEFIARPSETPTLAHRAAINSHLRCPHCSKRLVVEVHYDAEQNAVERHVCWSCSPYTTDAEDCDGFDPLAGIDLTPVPFCDEMDRTAGDAA